MEGLVCKCSRVVNTNMSRSSDIRLFQSRYCHVSGLPRHYNIIDQWVADKFTSRDARACFYQLASIGRLQWKSHFDTRGRGYA